MQDPEQYVEGYLLVRALGQLRRHSVRWGCRSHQIWAFDIETGKWRTDHGITEADKAKIRHYFLECRGDPNARTWISV